MANPDVSAISSSFVEFGGQVFGKNVLSWDIRNDGVEVRTNVKAPQVLPKLSAVGGPRPYRAQDDTSGNGVKFTDRTLTAYNSKWDYDFDPEEFRNTYLAMPAETRGMFAQEAAAQLAKEYLAGIYSSTLYLGVRNASGTGAADICSGWGKIIADEITATNLTPVATGAITAANAVTKVEQLADATPIWMKKNGYFIYCSYTVFQYYAANYRTLNGFQFQPNAIGRYSLDNRNAYLRPVGWMGTSNRIIATLDGNAVFGTDVEAITVASSVRRNIIEARPMMAAGCQWKDLEAMVVNDQA